jgi:hypothetical protein
VNASTINIFFKTIALFLLCSFAGWLNAQSPITVSVDTRHPGAAISPDFSGLSFEITRVLPDANGSHYFSPDNRRLVNLFQTLGIKSLRVGGNTSDRSAEKLPDHADLDSLFEFAKAADVKVIYCLRLREGNPEADARIVKYIMDKYPDQVDCFSIGQEANVYPMAPRINSNGEAAIQGVKQVNLALASARREAAMQNVWSAKPSYPIFAKEWKIFQKAILAAAPDAKFCGPGVDDDPSWPQRFMADFSQSNHIVLITTHLYPGRSGDKVPTPEIGRDEMLSNGFYPVYQKLYDGFVVTAQEKGLPYRLEEANNFYNGGATNVSNTFASALWGLDFLYWWAEHGAAGLNLHTGDKVAAGDEMRPSKYTPFVTTADGFFVRPLGYGIKAFDIGAHGTILPAAVSNPDKLNIGVYAVYGDDKSVYLTVINKEHGAQGKEADVALFADARFTGVQTMLLTASHNDIADTAGITLGGSEIDNNGRWNGTWNELDPPGTGLLTVKIPATSAGIIKLTWN